MKMNNQNSNESGNAIIWILIAVGLFASLNYAWTSTSRNSTSILDDSEAKAYASQIIAYGNEVKATVKRLQLRGCDETEISFENNIVLNYVNPNAPSNKSCHVFDIAGGGLSWKEFEPVRAVFTNGNAIEGVGNNCADPSCSELMMVLRLTPTVFTSASTQQGKIICNAINKALNNDLAMAETTIGDDTPGSGFDSYFVGEYKNDFLNDKPIFNGIKTYCAAPNINLSSYHHVLISR